MYGSYYLFGREIHLPNLMYTLLNVKDYKIDSSSKHERINACKFNYFCRVMITRIKRKNKQKMLTDTVLKASFLCFTVGV